MFCNNNNFWPFDIDDNPDLDLLNVNFENPCLKILNWSIYNIDLGTQHHNKMIF